MSAQTTPNSKLVNVPMEVPREPEAYRPTEHMVVRLKERVPKAIRPTVVEDCIRHGTCKGADFNPDDDNMCDYFSFETEVSGATWRLIVGINPDAFFENGVKHKAVTIYPLEDDDE